MGAAAARSWECRQPHSCLEALCETQVRCSLCNLPAAGLRLGWLLSEPQARRLLGAGLLQRAASSQAGQLRRRASTPERPPGRRRPAGSERGRPAADPLRPPGPPCTAGALRPAEGGLAPPRSVLRTPHPVLQAWSAPSSCSKAWAASSSIRRPSPVHRRWLAQTGPCSPLRVVCASPRGQGGQTAEDSRCAACSAGQPGPATVSGSLQARPRRSQEPV